MVNASRTNPAGVEFRQKIVRPQSGEPVNRKYRFRSAFPQLRILLAERPRGHPFRYSLG